jgi:hypothetical protein
MHWFSVYWWKYLFSKPFNFTKFFCRIRGHKCGVIWYNSVGLEPDMICKNCFDDLG